MKTLRLFLVIALFLAGTVASTVPLFAAPYSPPQGSVVSITAQQPTPTPWASPSSDPIDCSSGC